MRSMAIKPWRWLRPENKSAMAIGALVADVKGIHHPLEYEILDTLLNVIDDIMRLP